MARPESIMLQNLPIILFRISLISAYYTCFYAFRIWIILPILWKTIIIGIKQSYKCNYLASCNIKASKSCFYNVTIIDQCTFSYSNFNVQLMSCTYIPQLHNYANNYPDHELAMQPYALIETTPKTLTVLLEYIDLFNLRQYVTGFGKTHHLSTKINIQKNTIEIFKA